MKLVQGNCLRVLPHLPRVDCIFADPFDNIGLRYSEFNDKMPDNEYIAFLWALIWQSTRKTDIFWMSFNARWTFEVGQLFAEFLLSEPEWEGKACTQVFTFGQHNKWDLGNNHRPLWRLKKKSAPLYPEQIKVPSWRQRNGDKRAAPGGRVPGDVFDMQPKPPAFNFVLNVEFEHDGTIDEAKSWSEVPIHPGDVFDFPRVTGNSKQRCDWHVTQLHEDLVERVIKLSTKPGDTVLDPFGGTGTTLRVCQRIGRDCTLIELDGGYCKHIAEANGLEDYTIWEK